MRLLRVWVTGLLLCLAAPALTAPPSGPGNPFGVVVATEGRSASELEADLDQAVQLGVGWVRLLPDWTRLEPLKGQLDWSWTDECLQAAQRRHLQVLLTLGNTPRWASRYPDEDTVVWNRNPPKDLANWQRYVQALGKREGGLVGCWQVWDRSAIHFFRGSDKDLVELSRVTVQTVRARDRQALVLAPDPGLKLGAINDLYSYGIQRYVGGFALYPAFQRPEQVLRPLQVLQTDLVARKGPLMQLWVAGFGWAVEPVPGPLAVPVVSQADQARYLVRLAVLARGQGVEHIFWQGLRDRLEGPYQDQSRGGLLRSDGSPRPAWTAYHELITRIGARTMQGQAQWGPHAFGFLFASSEASLPGLLVIWSDRPPVKLAGPPAGLQACDLLGHARGLPQELDEEPCYVTGPVESLRSWMKSPALQAAPADPDLSKETQVSLVLSSKPQEHGLWLVSRSRPLQEDGLHVVEREGSEGWSTDLAHSQTGILFDVDDSFAYFVDGRQAFEVEVEVYGTAGPPQGFNLGYDSVKGYTFSKWQVVEPGWKTYSFRLSDANFCDPYSDLRFNALGSRADLVVRAVRVRKAAR